MTMRYDSEILKTLSKRGFIKDITDPDTLDEKAAAGPITAYVGYDLTASALHVGSLVSIMVMRHLQAAGHRPIILLGSATTKIGDPSDKDTQRPLLSHETVEENKKGIARIFDRFLDVDDPEKGVIFVDNEDWLGALTYLEVLRTYGPHFTLNRMLTFDSVKRRLSREQPLTFLEFNYMILQAVDYLELSRRYDCVLQLGGSDQWGNIVNGTELVRRMDGRDVFGLTTPLITTSSGAKMGKTAEGTVWLDPTMTSAYAYWQFWRNTADADVGRFLRLYTEVPVEEIEALEALSGAELNQAKIRLAMEATTLLHGAEAAENARQTAEQVFAAGGVGEDLPRLILSPDEAREGLSVVDGLIRAELAASKGEARRHIQGGGVRIDGEVVDDPYADLPVSETMSAPLRLSLGKKRHVVVELGDPAAD